MLFKSLKGLNKIAAKDKLELVRTVYGSNKVYFRWMGLTDEMNLKIAGLYSSGVYVSCFKHLDCEHWLTELENVKKNIANLDEEIIYKTSTLVYNKKYSE